MEQSATICALLDTCGRSGINLLQLRQAASRVGWYQPNERDLSLLESAGYVTRSFPLNTYELTRAGDDIALKKISALSSEELDALIQAGEMQSCRN